MEEKNFESPIVLSLKNVTKKFTLRHENSIKERILFFKKSKTTKSDFIALNNLSLEFNAGHTIGLIGHNGSGKSTLLKIIGGIIDPTNGDVLRRGRLAALLELGAGFHPDLTGRENVYMNAAILGMSRSETESKFDQIVEFAGIGEFIDTQVKFYSSGMYVRLGFSVAIHTDPDILLVDEVLAVGDEAFQRKCLDKISEFQKDGRTIILVTHNLSQVLDLCDRAILLDHGSLVFDGPAPQAVEEFRNILDASALSAGSVTNNNSLIESVIIKSSNKRDSSVVKLGTDFQISVKLKELTDTRNLICSMAIINRQNQLVFGSQVNRISGNEFQKASLVHFNIKDARLAAGVYSINISLVNGDNHIHIEDAVDLAQFELSAPFVTQGSVFMDSQASFS